MNYGCFMKNSRKYDKEFKLNAIKLFLDGEKSHQEIARNLAVQILHYFFYLLPLNLLLNFFHEITNKSPKVFLR